MGLEGQFPLKSLILISGHSIILHLEIAPFHPSWRFPLLSDPGKSYPHCCLTYFWSVYFFWSCICKSRLLWLFHPSVKFKLFIESSPLKCYSQQQPSNLDGHRHMHLSISCQIPAPVSRWPLQGSISVNVPDCLTRPSALSRFKTKSFDFKCVAFTKPWGLYRFILNFT